MPLSSDCDLVESCTPPLSHLQSVGGCSQYTSQRANLLAVGSCFVESQRQDPKPVVSVDPKYNAVMSRAEFKIGIKDREFSLLVGDITKIPADAIGNAANSRLAGGGGVDGAIHRAGGPVIMQELDQIRARIGQCPAGDAVATSAGKLPARWVIHAVGPVYRDGRSGEPVALRSCYERCLELSDELGARTLTLPAISTGVYGYPMDLAAEVAVSAVASKLSGGETRVERVTFVLFDGTAFQQFAAAALDIMPTLAS